MTTSIEIYSPLGDHVQGARCWSGSVTDPDLDAIFRYFNRVDHADSQRLAAIGYDLPSMTAGDLIHFPDTDRWVLVCSIGFADLTEREVSEILNSDDPYLTAMLYARGGGKIDVSTAI